MSSRLVARVRGAVAGALLRRVAGPDPTAARAAIHEAPGPRWFDEGSAIARVHGDASMFPGGLAALLLQSLNPRAMAAVAAHSGYLSDPWGRLQRTATFLAATTFGPADQAAQSVAVVRAVHERVRGVTPEGEPYHAADPHLITWVHVAEVTSFLAAHQRFGRRPLDAAGCDAYVAEAAVVGRALGGADVPETFAELQARLEGYRPELRRSEAATQAARFLLLSPPLPWFARPVYGLIALGGTSLLPDWSRAPLALPRGRVVNRVLDTLGTVGGRLVTGTIRWALDAAPPGQPEQREQPGQPDATPPGAPVVTGTGP